MDADDVASHLTVILATRSFPHGLIDAVLEIVDTDELLYASSGLYPHNYRDEIDCLGDEATHVALGRYAPGGIIAGHSCAIRLIYLPHQF